LHTLTVLAKVNDVANALATSVERVVDHRAASRRVIVADAGELVHAGQASGLHLLREGLLGDTLLKGGIHALIGLSRNGRRLVGDGGHGCVSAVAASVDGAPRERPRQRP